MNARYRLPLTSLSILTLCVLSQPFATAEDDEEGGVVYQNTSLGRLLGGYCTGRW
jgi:hypothetical protein